jgi:6-phosphogluconate dehydrogenase
MHEKGLSVAVYNRTVSKVDDFAAQEARGTSIVCCRSLHAFLGALASPKRILLMVKSGSPVDEWIAQILPQLAPGDIVMDGGNSHYKDTERRCAELKLSGIHFIGCGISGGEEGARHGPSLMPGGAVAAWPHVAPLFEAIAAKGDLGGRSVTCCHWMGAGGAGHYVKMVHNGIEYADMQALCDLVQVCRHRLQMSSEQIGNLLSSWRDSHLASFLLDAAALVLTHKSPEDGGNILVDYIRDVAGQKGTGKWTVEAALDVAVPAPLFSDAVFARCLSAAFEIRQKAASCLPGPPATPNSASVSSLMPPAVIFSALLCTRLLAYATGFQILQAASAKNEWQLDLAAICEAWSGGCIIRCALLSHIYAALKKGQGKASGVKQDTNTNDPVQDSFLFTPFFTQLVAEHQAGWRRVVAECATNGIPVSSFSAALSHYDALRTAKSSANILQAMRDLFGAHTYERIDRPAGTFYHTDWTGSGGHVASSHYQV